MTITGGTLGDSLSKIYDSDSALSDPGSRPLPGGLSRRAGSCRAPVAQFFRLTFHGSNSPPAKDFAVLRLDLNS